MWYVKASSTSPMALLLEKLLEAPLAKELLPHAVRAIAFCSAWLLEKALVQALQKSRDARRDSAPAQNRDTSDTALTGPTAILEDIHRPSGGPGLILAAVIISIAPLTDGGIALSILSLCLCSASAILWSRALASSPVPWLSAITAYLIIPVAATVSRIDPTVMGARGATGTKFEELTNTGIFLAAAVAAFGGLLMSTFRHSFTVGEAWIVSRGFLLACLVAVNGSGAYEPPEQIVAICLVGAVGCMLGGSLALRFADAASVLLSKHRRGGASSGTGETQDNGCQSQRKSQNKGARSRASLSFGGQQEAVRTVCALAGVAAVGFGLVLPALSAVVGKPVLLWLAFFMGHHAHALVLSLAITVGCVALIATSRQFSSLHLRKGFHVLAIAMFVPLLYIDTRYLYYSLAFALVLFLLVEFFRACNAKPLSAWITMLTERFVDGQDAGPLVLTPIYLLLGVSLPIWLACGHAAPHTAPVVDEPLPLQPQALAGLISIGIGDTFAAIIGRSFGRTPLGGTKKTLEGLLGSIAAQLGFSWLLLSFGVLQEGVGLSRMLLPIMANAVVEATTDQIDNLVIPILTYFIFTLV